MKLSCRTFALGVTFLLATPTSALAQPTSDQRAMAQHDVDAGAKHFEAGQFHEAYVRLKSAAAVYPSPHVRANMVRAGSKSTYPQERVESARAARVLLREGKMRSEDAEQVKASLASLGPVLGRLEVRGLKDETVRLDGELVEATTLSEPLDVLPGKHEIVIGSEHHTVAVTAGTGYVLTLGSTEVQTTTAPVQPPPRSESKRVPREGRPIVVGVVGGLGLASIGVGVATFLIGSSARSDAEDRSQPFADRQDGADRANTMRTLSTVTIWAGGGLVGAAAITYFVWPKKVESRTATIRPMIGPVVGVQGSF